MEYVSLFKEFKLELYRDSSSYLTTHEANSRVGQKMVVVNCTGHDILVAYRDGRVFRLRSESRPDIRGKEYGTGPVGIYIYEDNTVPQIEMDRIRKQELAIRGDGDSNEKKRPFQIEALIDRSHASNRYSHEQVPDPRKVYMYSFLRVITEEVIATLHETFYDRESDIAFSIDVDSIDDFFHPYSERGSSKRLGDAAIKEADFVSTKDCFVNCIEIIDNEGEIGDRWIRPYANDEVFHIRAVRDEAISSGFRIFSTSPNGGKRKKTNRFMTETLNEEEFAKRFPHLRLFKNYSEAKHFDDRSELRTCKLELKRLQQSIEESDKAHVNAIAKLELERKNIDQKNRQLEESAAQRTREFEENLRQRQETHEQDMLRAQQAHDQKLRTAIEETERLKNINEELHRQKQKHREEEHKQDQKFSQEKNVSEDKTQKRKTFLEWVKSFPSMITSMLGAGVFLLKLIF